MRIRGFRFALSSCVAAALLAGCGGSQPPIGGPGTSNQQPAQSHSMTPTFNDYCMGTHGVELTPCPVKLNKKNGVSGVAIIVSGPGVVNSTVADADRCVARHGRNGRGAYCHIEPEGSGDVTQWLITSGTECGRAAARFFALNASGGIVGEEWLKIVNMYCPSS